MRNVQRDRRRTAGRLIYAVAVIACLVLWLLPLAGVALTSVHSTDELNRGDVWSWPAAPQWSNYAAVLQGSRLMQFVANSLLVTLPAVFLTVLLSAMAGFALAKHPFGGNRLLLVVFVAGNLVPFQVL